MEKLMKNIARILNESNIYRGKFTVEHDKIYANDCGRYEIDVAFYLEEVKGSYISGRTLEERGIM